MLGHPIFRRRPNVSPMHYNFTGPNAAMIAMPTDTTKDLSKISVDSSSVPQETVLRLVLPVIREEGVDYRKVRKVHARPAVPGEVVVSVTDAGAETRNAAEPDDMVVRNLTDAREEYIVRQTTFSEIYTEVGTVDDLWTLYESSGEVRGIEISRDLRDVLQVGKEFLIMAPWGTVQLCREGDLFVAPLPKLDEVYRIARSEFDQTYRPIA